MLRFEPRFRPAPLPRVTLGDIAAGLGLVAAFYLLAVLVECL
jgi:hypothetical protein